MPAESTVATADLDGLRARAAESAALQRAIKRIKWYATAGVAAFAVVAAAYSFIKDQGRAEEAAEVKAAKVDGAIEDNTTAIEDLQTDVSTAREESKAGFAAINVKLDDMKVEPPPKPTRHRTRRP